MLVHKLWTTSKRGFIYTDKTTREGWFLFGVIPLYIRTLRIERVVT